MEDVRVLITVCGDCGYATKEWLISNAIRQAGIQLTRSQVTVRRSEEKKTLRVELSRQGETSLLLYKQGIAFWGRDSPAKVAEVIKNAL